MLSGCTLNPFAKPPVTTPVQESPAPIATTTDNPVVASSTVSSVASLIRDYKKGIDYELDFPVNYFVDQPKVSEVSCDITKACPCLADPNYTDQNDFCQNIASTSRQGDVCIQKWSEGAAGSIYTTYVYTKALATSTDRCVALEFTTRMVTSCTVYEGNETNVKNCEAEKAMEPVMIERTVSSLKLLSSPTQSTDLKVLSDGVLKAISEKNFKDLALFVGADKKLCFSPYANINDMAECFTKDELESAFADKKELVWGYSDGKGDQIVASFAGYYKKFIYDKDYLATGEYFSGTPISRGNTLLNLKEVYPNGLFSEYYIKGNKDGLDWGSLRFVFEKVDGQMYLRAIVHDQWTI